MNPIAVLMFANGTVHSFAGLAVRSWLPHSCVFSPGARLNPAAGTVVIIVGVLLVIIFSHTTADLGVWPCGSLSVLAMLTGIA